MREFILGFCAATTIIIAASIQVAIDQDSKVKDSKPIIIEDKVYRCVEVKL